MALTIFLVILEEAVCPPVTEKKKGHEENKIDEAGEEDTVSLHQLLLNEI